MTRKNGKVENLSRRQTCATMDLKRRSVNFPTKTLVQLSASDHNQLAPKFLRPFPATDNANGTSGCKF